MVSMEMIKDKPWFGWGFDGYVAQYMNYQADYLTAHPDSPFVLLADETQNPFNEFLHVALIYGIPCAVAFVFVTLWTIWHIYAKVKEHKSVLLCTVCVLVVWFMFSYPLNIPFVWLIILFMFLSTITRTVKPPMPKLCMTLVQTTGFACMYSLYVTGAHDIRKLCLQERATNHCDEEIMKEYEEIYKEYYDDYMFIYNYGALLHLRGEYKKSLEVLNAGKKYLSDYNMMLLIGDDYQKLKQYDLAIASYKRAGEMIPSRYLPLYYRMELYLETGDMEKAYEIANMIINKKNKIKELRMKGIGYRNISSETGIPRDTVRSFCRRNGLDGYASAIHAEKPETDQKNGKEGQCRYCGKKLEQSPTGRKKKFCNEDCRRKWWKLHPEKINRKQDAFYKGTCAYCRREFFSYGNKGRRYCSHACYIHDRFWREEEGREAYIGPNTQAG